MKYIPIGPSGRERFDAFKEDLGPMGLNLATAVGKLEWELASGGYFSGVRSDRHAITVSMVVGQYSVHPSTLYRQINSGRLPVLGYTPGPGRSIMVISGQNVQTLAEERCSTP